MVWYMNYEESPDSSGSGKIRLWREAVEYGFVSAGGGEVYTHSLPKIEVGDEVWVSVPGSGYVGYGIVTVEAAPASVAVVSVGDKPVPFFSLPLAGTYFRSAFEDKQEFVVGVKWVKAVPVADALWEKGFFFYRGICCRPKKRWPETVARLCELWGIEK